MTSMKSALDRAALHARAYLETLDTGAVAAAVSRQELLSRFDQPLRREGVAADVVIDELAAAVDGGLVGSGSGRFFAWVIGGALPSAVATEWLMSAWDQNAAIYATSPVSSVVEEVAGKWLLDLMRLPAEASFGFTTGCQTAHFTALSAARDHLLRQRGWDVAEQGLAGSPPIRVFATPLHHVSLDRALRYLGIGDPAVAHVARRHRRPARTRHTRGRLVERQRADRSSRSTRVTSISASSIRSRRWCRWRIVTGPGCTSMAPLACSRAPARGSTHLPRGWTWPTAGRPIATSG